MTKSARSHTLFLVTLGAYIAGCLIVSAITIPRYGVPGGLVGLTGLAYMCIPWVLRRLMKLEQGYGVSMIILAFLFVANELGVALRWYYKIWWYDLFVHFLSGAVISLVGLCFYLWLERLCRKTLPVQPALRAIFSFLFSMTVAGIWELTEWMGFVLFGHDSQNVAATGVGDTMEDMMACLIGSALLCVLIWLHESGRYKSRLLFVWEEFKAAQPPLPDTEK